jgi:hypothetical protein
VVSPLLVLASLIALGQVGRRWHNETPGPWGLILGSSAVPLLGYGVLAFFADRERVSFHWLIQAWMPLLLVAPEILLRWSAGWRRLCVALATLGLLLAFAYLTVAATPSWRAWLAEGRWYPDNFAGWDEIAAIVAAREAGDSVPRRLLADNFMLAAQLDIGLGRETVAALDHPLNRKHGRARQLQLWGLQSTLGSQTGPWRLVIEDSATPMKDRLQRYRDLCADAGAWNAPEVVSLDHGRKRFLLIEGGSDSNSNGADCIQPALAWIDVPASGEHVASRFEVAGWAFKDGAGIVRIEVALDGEIVADAVYGLPAPHVTRYWKISNDPAHPDVGFHAGVDASSRPAGRYWLGLRLYGGDGSIEAWPEQRIEIRP